MRFLYSLPTSFVLLAHTNFTQLKGLWLLCGILVGFCVVQPIFNHSWQQKNSISLADSDGDGYDDSVDNCPFVFNNLQEDADADNKGDVCDNCPSVFNSLQTNADGDSRGDVCDNCPSVSNNLQTDIDGDSKGDVCDNCPLNSNASQINSDTDSKGDVCDNCPLIANDSQTDSDSDGIGDACDVCPFVSGSVCNEINLQGNSVSIADGDTSPAPTDHTDFGATGISTPLVRTFTIQNTGTATLNITSIGNTNTTDFTVGTAPTSIVAGGSATFTVTLNSATMGTKNATIAVNSDDADEAAYDFAITGRVINATPDTKRGNMLSLDGVETTGFDHVSIPDNASLNIGTGQLTLAAWVKRDVAGTFDNIIMKGSYGYGLVIDDSDKLGYWSDFLYTNCFSAGNIPANVWTHVAIVVNAGVSTTLYINGVNVGTSTNGSHTVINNNADILAFGTQDIGSCNCNNHGGNIDEVQIWNVALTQAQIRERMHLTLSGAESGLVGYWQFNEASGNAIDAVNGNNGTLQNGASRPESTVSVAKGVATRLTAPAGASAQVFGNATVNFTTMSAPATNDEFVTYQLQDTPLNNVSANNTASNYWLVRQFGTQTFSYDQMNFTLPASNVISTTDEGTPSNLKLFKRTTNSAGVWGTEIGTGTSASNTTKQIVYSISPAQTSFSEFIPASVTSPLPITLLGLKGQRVEGLNGEMTEEIRLEWATASEINNKGFEVEMSEDGLTYQKIAFVEGKGNSGNIYHLSFINASDSYYRLKQVDFDGTFSYSPVVFVEGVDALKVYPNPSNGTFTISVGKDKLDAPARLLNAQGTVVATSVTTSQNGEATKVATTGLPAGIYFLHTTVAGKTKITKIIIEK